jgi:1,4-alpha-glucan branching enzyme
MNKKASPKAKSKTKTKKVQFNLYLPDAERVFLTGDFNNWDVVSLPMKKDGHGTWEANIDLPPGRYEYRFWANGAWHDDPNTHAMVENPFGSQNCVRIVT